MLRDKKDNEVWSFDEILKEQLAFETSKGLAHIVHAHTVKPYYAYELAEVYLKREFEKLQSEKLKSLPRKKAFTDLELLEMVSDRERGLSIRQLARKYNKSTATIQKYLKIKAQKVYEN